MKKIIKILCVPIVCPVMWIMAYIGSVMTWGLTAPRDNFKYLWDDYWKGEEQC